MKYAKMIKQVNFFVTIFLLLLDTYNNEITKECTLCPTGCQFCLGPNPTDCLILTGIITHSSELNTI